MDPCFRRDVRGQRQGCGFFFSVMPAQAGIQGRRLLACSPWIPAFAGMTIVGDVPYSAASVTFSGSTRAAQNLNSGILPNGSSTGLVSRLAAAST